MGTAKIDIKIGTMELAYEGDPSFLNEGLEKLLTTMGELARQTGPELAATLGEQPRPSAEMRQQGAGSQSFSTNTIAAHFDARSAPELLVCALGKLEIVDGKTSATRLEIHAEMKAATSYFSTVMTSNLSKTISNLVRQKRINNIAGSEYALSAAEKRKIEAKLATID